LAIRRIFFVPYTKRFLDFGKILPDGALATAFQYFRKNGFLLISPAYEIFHSSNSYMLKLTTVIFRLRNHPDSKFKGIIKARAPEIFLFHSRWRFLAVVSRLAQSRASECVITGSVTNLSMHTLFYKISREREITFILLEAY
jgi:hypothetical protein